MLIAKAIGKLKMRLGVTNLRVRGMKRDRLNVVPQAVDQHAATRWVIWSSV